ncbi:MAG: sulfatase-like hydrolase/transferase [Sedimentisphaerales bacterium]|nr:sulfatase-like hydrolase/transferase [Sedimentisphaerales bacterium]
MNRRGFLKAAGAASMSLAWSNTTMGQTKPAQPNLLIIHTDQLSCWAVSAYARELNQTPNYEKVLVETPYIDSLAKEGATLYNFFTNSAVCTPSRGCLLTGRYPHAHGAYRNNIEMNRDEVTIAHILNRHGYETGYAGKWHLDGEPKPGWVGVERSMGFADCRFMFNRGHWKKIVEKSEGNPEVSPYQVIGDRKTYTTDWLTDKTIEFIQKPRSRPFFYMVSIPDPHTPFTVREPYMTMYDPEKMIVPNTFEESASGNTKKRQGNVEALKRNKARYCGLVKCIDDNVGRILDCLKKKHILDETIIVFTTDHGEYMGEHGLYGKNQWYRTAYQIPFLIRWPEKIKAGTAIRQFITNVDFQQTLLGLMEVKPSGREQGRDASPLLRGETVEWKDEAMIHHSSLESTGIFTPDYELVLKSNGNHMLFSRLNDPEQTKNLSNNPEYKNVMKELTERIIKHNINVDAPAISWLKSEAEKPGVKHIT